MDDLNSNGGGGASENDEGLGVTRRKRAGSRKELGAAAVIGRGKPLIVGMCGTLVYYHCAYRDSSIISLISDVFIVLLCSLAILGLLFRQMNIQFFPLQSAYNYTYDNPVPVDPLEWQISQDTANGLFACLANTVGAAESVLRVAATGHDKRLFLKVVVILYMLSALGRIVSGVTVAYAGLCLFCLYILAENSSLFGSCSSKFCWRRDSPNDELDST
ncbi:reticulon-like protein B22 isoform X1 [Lactuca sativa]|uniref:reticulon-like protein B22 isoform X1 n=1 Tax=Lactuca sativa TaxID=4236 RepID=UPI000CD8B90C|nr:reticulon-like protein B22 isoform X1 [Lactuca sativa]